MFKIFVLLLFFTYPLGCFAQKQFSIKLPIILIETNGEGITNESKIDALMKVFNDFIPNSLDEIPELSCKIGIEIRGNSSQMFPKKQYALETRKDDGTNLNISLLGLPDENDWILSAPYDDKTLIRNPLSYELLRQMGWYTPRSRFCELFINGNYRGIYELTEKIKKDKNRVPISKNGFIIETTGKERIKDYESSFTSAYFKRPQVIKYPQNPSEKEIGEIETSFNHFEEFIHKPDFKNTALESLDSFFDTEASIDYLLLSEAIRNLDGLRYSTFWYKDQFGKLTLGPLWDCNISLGNANYQKCWEIEGSQILHCYWALKLFQNINYKNKAQERWLQLRENVLSNDNIELVIDSLVQIINPSIYRNFEQWDILDKYVWPNYFVGHTHQEELYYLKNWFFNRLNWMDYYMSISPFYAKLSAHKNENHIIIKGDSLEYSIFKETINGNYDLLEEGICIDSVTFTDSNVPDYSECTYKISSKGYSQFLICLPEPQIPESPSGLTFSTVNDTTINFTWNDKSNNEAYFHIEKLMPDGYEEIEKLYSDSCEYIYSNIYLEGTYRVYASNRIGKSAPSSTLIIPRGEKQIKMFPTIVSSELNLLIKNMDQTNIQIEILSALGDVIFSEKQKVNSSFENLLLTLPQMQTGTYLLFIKSSEFQETLLFIQK